MCLKKLECRTRDRPVFIQLIQRLNATQWCRLFIWSAKNAKHGVAINVVVVIICQHANISPHAFKQVAAVMVARCNITTAPCKGRDASAWPRMSPTKSAPSHGGSGPHLICGSTGISESTAQMVLQSVHPFLQSARFWPTHTDRPLYIDNNTIRYAI